MNDICLLFITFSFEIHQLWLGHQPLAQPVSPLPPRLAHPPPGLRPWCKLSWPGAAGPLYPARGVRARQGVAVCLPANRRRPCTEADSFGPTPTVPRGSARRAGRARRAGGSAQEGWPPVAACACALGLFFTKLLLKWAGSLQPPVFVRRPLRRAGRSVEQQLPCCPDFLRNLNELFVDNHWSCLQDFFFFARQRHWSVLSEDHILYVILTFFFGLTLYFYRFCYNHGAGKGEEFDNKLWLS